MTSAPTRPRQIAGEAPPVGFTGAYPGDIKDCQTCHVADGYNLPPATAIPTRFLEFTCSQAFDPASTDAWANVCGPNLSTATPPTWSGGVIVPDSTNGNAYWTKSAEILVQTGAASCGSCHDTTAA